MSLCRRQPIARRTRIRVSVPANTTRRFDVPVLPSAKRRFDPPPNDLPVEVEEPKNPQVGQMRYADGTGWDPGSGEGVYVYTSTGWSKL